MRFVQLYFECLGGDLIYSDNDLSFDSRLLSFPYFALSQTLSLYLSDDGEWTFFFRKKKLILCYSRAIFYQIPKNQ